MFLSGIMLVSCFGSQSDAENLDVVTEETASTDEAVAQGQEAYENNQIALAGGENELSDGEESNYLTVGVDPGGENQLAEDGTTPYGEENLLQSSVNEAEVAGENIANIAAGDDADVLAEAGTDPTLASGQENEAIESVMNENAVAMNESSSIDNTASNDMPMADNSEDMMSGASGTAAPPMLAATAGSSLPEMGSRMTYIVKKGDTLGDIAQAIYDDKSKWRDLAAWSGFANPHLIFPGNIVYYQYTEKSAEFATRYEGQKKSEVVVQAGDTLSGIAANVYGDLSSWVLIWRYNGHIANPDKIKPGQIIYYPEQGFLSASEVIGNGSEEVATGKADTEAEQAAEQEMTKVITHIQNAEMHQG